LKKISLVALDKGKPPYKNFVKQSFKRRFKLFSIECPYSLRTGGEILTPASVQFSQDILLNEKSLDKKMPFFFVEILFC